MTDGADLLRTILAEPDEDLHRLKYADWLQEEGHDDRAEFIRVQVALAAINASSLDEQSARFNERYELMERETALMNAGGAATLSKNKYKWLGDALREAAVFGHATPEESAAGLRFTRGFIESLTCGLKDWLTHADAILAAHPIKRVAWVALSTLAGRDELVYRARRESIPVGGRLYTDIAEDLWPGVAFALHAAPTPGNWHATTARP